MLPELIRREQSMSTESAAPRVVNLPVSSALQDYLRRVEELGVVEGADGALALNPTLAPVLAALHHVLAGGEVEVRITRTGQATLVKELQERAARSFEETNALNQQPGTEVDVAV
jgi:hypothetical protein